MNEDKADFEVVGTIGTFFPDRAGKVVRLSVRVRGVRDSVVDMKYFGSLPAFSKGDRVRVSGNVSSEKLPGITEQGRNGKTYDKWVPLLAARKVEALERAQGTIPGAANDNSRPPRRATGTDDDIPF